jgi:hypothetical protein
VNTEYSVIESHSFPSASIVIKDEIGRHGMLDAFRVKLFCLLVLLSSAACRDVGVPDGCRQKISSRLFNELSNTGVKERKYRLVIRLNDSAGVTEAFPSVTVANKAVATGYLTAAEIRKLCILRQVLYIDLPKQYHKLEQN